MNFILKIILVILPLILVMSQLAANAHTLTGYITDTSGKPLQGAIIKAISDNGKIVAYATAKSAGKFSLTVPDSISNGVNIIVSHRQHDNETFPLHTLTDNCHIELLKSATTLDEIVVMPSPIKSKGDTVTYSVDAMKLMSDRSIGDVISHLPGVSIDSQGNIIYQGNPINKFYIEDMDMLGGYYSIASENIRADDVASISVYENHQPIKALKDISLSEQAALNLTLKKKAMLKPVGYVLAGIGRGDDEMGWKGELYSMLVNKKSQTFITAKGTNFGVGYALENKMRASLSQLTELPVENVYQLNPIGIPAVPGLNCNALTSQSYSVNTGLKCNTNSTLYANINYSNELTDNSGWNNLEYLTGNSQLPVIIEQSAKTHTNGSTINANITFENNSDNLFINNTVLMSGSFSHGNADIISSIDSDISQRLRKKLFNITDMFRVSIKSGRKIWDMYANVYFTSLPNNRLIINESSENIIQQASGNMFQLNMGTSWGHYFNPYNQGGLNLILNYSLTNIDTYTLLDNTIDKDFDNNQRGSEFKLDLGPYWQFKSNRVTARFELPIHLEALLFSHLNTNSQSNPKWNDFVAKLGGNVKVSYSISNGLKASANISHHTSSGNINNFITAPIYYSYRGYSSIGSGSLSSSRRTLGKIQLEYRNVMQSLFGNISLVGSINKSNHTYASFVSDQENTSVSENRPNTRKMFVVTSQLSKIFGPCTLRAEINGTYLSGNSIVNGVDLSTNSSQWSFNISSSIETLSRKLNLTPSVTFQTLATKSSGPNDTSDSSHSWLAKADISFYPISAIEVKAIPSFYASSPPADNNFNIFLMNLSVLYKFRSFRIELNVTNVTNRKKYESIMLTPLVKTVTIANLRGIEGLLSLNYSF